MLRHNLHISLLNISTWAKNVPLILGPDLASTQQRDKREKESERIELKKRNRGVHCDFRCTPD